MPKKVFLISFLISIVLFFVFPETIFAQTKKNCDYTQEPATLIENLPPLSNNVPEDERWFKFRIKVTDTTATYKVVFQEGTGGIGAIERGELRANTEKVLKQPNNDLPGLQMPNFVGAGLFKPGTHHFYVERQGVTGHYCDGTYYIEKDISGGILSCDLTFSPSDPDERDIITITGGKIQPPKPPGAQYWLNIVGITRPEINLDGSGNITTPITVGKLSGTLTAVLEINNPSSSGPEKPLRKTNCGYRLYIAPEGSRGSITKIGQEGPGGISRIIECLPGQCAKSTAGKRCGEDEPGILTAIGCVRTSPVGFTKDFLRFMLGIGGGLAFLMMLLGAFQMLTSAGNPDTLHAGRERLTSAIIGLLIIIFSVLLLQIVGVGILTIPGFDR